MKHLGILIMVLALLISGCRQNPTGDNADQNSSDYSDSAPAIMLETPDKAREAANAANDSVQAAQEAEKSALPSP